MKIKNKAFTLVEILVSISIITVLMAVTVFSYSSFNDKIALTEAGQEMLIAFRQAQSYGVNVRETSIGSNDFAKTFGIYFNYTNSPTSYYIFVDKDSNKTYSDALGSCGGAECIEKIDLDRGIRITGITTGPALSAICNSLPPNDVMIALFQRPVTSATINFAHSSTPTTFCYARQYGTVTLTSAQGQVLNVKLNHQGQVSAQ